MIFPGSLLNGILFFLSKILDFRKNTVLDLYATGHIIYIGCATGEEVVDVKTEK